MLSVWGLKLAVGDSASLPQTETEKEGYYLVLTCMFQYMVLDIPPCVCPHKCPPPTCCNLYSRDSLQESWDLLLGSEAGTRREQNFLQP